jgi:hypothetical protein
MEINMRCSEGSSRAVQPCSSSSSGSSSSSSSSNFVVTFLNNGQHLYFNKYEHTVVH